MKVEVGVYQGPSRQSGGWYRICEQEGFPFRPTDAPDAPVMLIEGAAPPWLDRYLQEGGVALVTEAQPETLPFEAPHRGEAVVFRTHFEVAGLENIEMPCLGTLFPGDGWGEVRLHHRRLEKATAPGRFPVFRLARHGKGLCLFTGLPLTRLLTVEGDTLRRFSELAEVTERVSTVDKGKIATLLVWALRRLFQLARIPYVHLAYYPDGAPSVFTFRIDVDGTYGDHLLAISKTGRAIDLPITFFLNKSLCAGQEEYLRAIDPLHEIGNHADVHDLFDTVDENLSNVQRCREWMDEQRIPHGPWFAAPRGMYNSQLGLALEALGYEYSSDFGVDMDALPFFPRVGGRRLSLLQIPVHPYSTERAAVFAQETGTSRPTAHQVLAYFQRVSTDLVERGLPVMLYSHPQYFGPLAHDVLPPLKRHVERMGVRVTTVSQFAAWWKERDRTALTAELDRSDGSLRLDGALPEGVHVRVEAADPVHVVGGIDRARLTVSAA